ncbi:uncharacterized protein [Diadema antillarum]|uniref:uncharacterized protein n=1 Tax=Diadema antillarum TaxID=105358 RepID=UPI003A8A2117
MVHSPTYGRTALRPVRRHERCSKRLARFSNHLTFLTRCIKNSVIPKDLRVHPPVPTKKARLIAINTSRRFLRERIRLTRVTIKSIRSEIDSCTTRIRTTLAEEYHTGVLEHSDKVYRIVFEKCKAHPQSKYLKLCDPATNIPLSSVSDSWVVTLSKRKLSSAEKALLSKGPNFAVAPTRVPATEIIAKVESSVRTLSAETVGSVRREVSAVLATAQPLKPNITPDMRKALKSLKEEDSITVLPADKGRASVVLDTDVYRAKMTELIDSGPSDATLPQRTQLSPTKIVDVLKFVLYSTYFMHNGDFYEQQEGAPMGSPVSAVIANLYMEFFEEQALKTCPPNCAPRVWKRYVDDTFIITARSSANDLLEHMNAQQPSIRFTMETESDERIAFLDTLVHRDTEGRLTTTVIAHTLRQRLEKHDIRVVFKSDTIRNQLVRPKDPVLPVRRHGVVYKIPCSTCDKIYIGKTGRPVGERMHEHRRDVRLGRTESSAVAEHAWSSEHHPNWEKVSCIAQDKHWYTRRVKEAIHIRLHPNNINRDSGIDIPDEWLSAIRRHSTNRFEPVRDSTPPATAGNSSTASGDWPLTAANHNAAPAPGAPRPIAGQRHRPMAVQLTPQ